MFVAPFMVYMSLPDMIQGDDANIKCKGKFIGHIGVVIKYEYVLLVYIAITLL